MTEANAVFKEFNKATKEFIKELIVNFPHFESLKLMLNFFTISKKLNKKLPHKLFNKYLVKPYHTQLMNKDNDYFTSDKFTFSFWNTFVDQAKVIWADLSHENREAIWKHIHVLIALNKKCLQQRSIMSSDSGDEAV